MGPALPPLRVRSRKHPLASGAILAAAIVAVAAAAIFVFQPPASRTGAKPAHPAKSLPPNPAAPVSAPLAAAALPEPATAPSPAAAPPAATPAPPALDPEQQLKLAIGESAEYESASDWKGALSSAVQLVRDFPNYDKGPARLEDLIGRLSTKGEFARHWPTYEPVLERGFGSRVGPRDAAARHGRKKEDPVRALPILQKAADLGVREAMTEVGLAYLHGEGTPKDVAEAERWFQKASDHGDPAGMLILGESYLSGKGVKQDNAKALKLIQEAADHRSGDAKNLLGKLYLYGRAGLVANKPTAIEYFRRAKDLKCPEAFYNLGMMAYTAKGPLVTPARAAGLFEGGAKLGHSLSMFYYARCLDEGTGVLMSRTDAQMWYGKAIEPLKKESESGSRAAMVCYAMALDQGLGVDKNVSEAKHWYAKAATLGDTMAEQWCFQNHVDFQMPPPSSSTSMVSLPHKVYIGKRVATPLQ